MTSGRPVSPHTATTKHTTRPRLESGEGGRWGGGGEKRSQQHPVTVSFFADKTTGEAESGAWRTTINKRQCRQAARPHDLRAAVGRTRARGNRLCQQARRGRATERPARGSANQPTHHWRLGMVRINSMTAFLRQMERTST